MLIRSWILVYFYLLKSASIAGWGFSQGDTLGTYIDRSSMTLASLLKLVTDQDAFIQLADLPPETKLVHVGYQGASEERVHVYTNKGVRPCIGMYGPRIDTNPSMTLAALDATVDPTGYKDDSRALCHLFLPVSQVQQTRIRLWSRRQCRQIHNMYYDRAFDVPHRLDIMACERDSVSFPQELARNFVAVCEPIPINPAEPWTRRRYRFWSWWLKKPWNQVWRPQWITQLLLRSRLGKVPVFDFRKAAILSGEGRASLPVLSEQEQCRYCRLATEAGDKPFLVFESGRSTHILVIAKLHHPKDVTQLEPKHIPLIQNMYKTCTDALRDRGYHVWQEHIGFKVPPYNEEGHLTMHCLVKTMDSYADQYSARLAPFISTSDVLEELKRNKKIKKVTKLAYLWKYQRRRWTDALVQKISNWLYPPREEESDTDSEREDEFPMHDYVESEEYDMTDDEYSDSLSTTSSHLEKR